MGPMDTLIRIGLHNADTDDLVEELGSRFDKVGISGIKFRMNQQVEHESRNSALSADKIKLELAKQWLGV